MAPMSSGAPSRSSARRSRRVASSSRLGPTDWGSQPSANRAVRRVDSDDEVYRTADEKYQAIIKEINPMKHQQVFFTCIHYTMPYNLLTREPVMIGGAASPANCVANSVLRFGWCGIPPASSIRCTRIRADMACMCSKGRW